LKVYDLENNEIIISRDVVFHETIFHFSTYHIREQEGRRLIGNNNVIVDEFCLHDWGFHEGIEELSQMK